MSKQDSKAGFSLNRSATHLLHRAQQAAVTLSAGSLGAKGLTIRHFAVLAALYGQDDQSQSSLVEMTGIDRSTLADMVSRMEHSRLIRRVTSKIDARVKAVSLAAAGIKAYTNAAAQVEAADAELLKSLGKSQRKDLLKALAQLTGATPDRANSKKSKKGGKPGKKKKKKNKSG